MGRKPLAAAAALSASLAAAVLLAPPAMADDWALNGTFSVTSNGDWATTNDIYRNEATVRSTWTIAMTCSDPVTCKGQVHSDAGWSSEINSRAGEYIVRRELANWETCADGRTGPGHQSFRFFPVDENGSGLVRLGSPIFAGFDLTSGDSGACSINQRLQIDMPLRLDRLT